MHAEVALCRLVLKLKAASRCKLDCVKLYQVLCLNHLANERVSVKPPAVVFFAAVIGAVGRSVAWWPYQRLRRGLVRQMLTPSTCSFQGFSSPSILKWCSYIRPLARLVSRRLEVDLSCIAKLSLPPTSFGNKVKKFIFKFLLWMNIDE